MEQYCSLVIMRSCSSLGFIPFIEACEQTLFGYMGSNTYELYTYKKYSLPRYWDLKETWLNRGGFVDRIYNKAAEQISKQ